jgi:hypothetical protein
MQKMSEMRSDMDYELAGNPFKGLAEVMVETIQLEWGWAILIIGVIMVFAAAHLKQGSMVLAKIEQVTKAIRE